MRTDRLEVSLYPSERAAAAVASSAVKQGPANGLLVRPRRKRNPDRSVDVGFVAGAIPGRPARWLRSRLYKAHW
jgi:hypothetical protein